MRLLAAANGEGRVDAGLAHVQFETLAHVLDLDLLWLRSNRAKALHRLIAIFREQADKASAAKGIALAIEEP